MCFIVQVFNFSLQSDSCSTLFICRFSLRLSLVNKSQDEMAKKPIVHISAAFGSLLVPETNAIIPATAIKQHIPPKIFFNIIITPSFVPFTRLKYYMELFGNVSADRRCNVDRHLTFFFTITYAKRKANKKVYCRS